MKNQSLQTMLDELHDESPETIDEIADQDLEFISGGQVARQPTECQSGYVSCGSGYKNN
ncbi:hypothetical protein J9978_23175 [Chromobacterium violaceum]|uniref:hypothetical protein n=1 Tax=Chromobacterium violaceum TaxID=536 RepID=UPI000A807437|nr:hypothetical protein [Chromobacterium violaceum]MBA8733479.1 hypothetical protein [Chromobacterium violaceum]MBP4052379.1 hypothetical protein [Chromobacterium violaceum]